MTHLQSLLTAQKYAQAFVHTFAQQLSSVSRQELEQAQLFAKAHKKIFWCADIITDDAQRKEIIPLLKDKLACPSIMESLLRVLNNSRRLHLLPMVLEQIIHLMMEKEKKVVVLIESSHELLEDEKELLITFFTRTTGYQPVPTFAINKNLIAGIRIASDIFLWEQSIDKQLRTFNGLFQQ